MRQLQPRSDHLPELEQVEARDRKAVCKAARRMVPARWRIGFWMVYFLVFLIASLAADRAFEHWLNPMLPRAAVVGLFGGAAGAVGGFLYLAFDRLFVRPMIWRRLPVLCNSCGYNLTGNTSGVCPECGREIERDRPPPPPTGESS